MADKYNALLTGVYQLIGEATCPVNQYDGLARSRPPGDDEVTVYFGFHNLALTWM